MSRLLIVRVDKLRSLWFGTRSFPHVTVGSWTLALRLAIRLACAPCTATVTPETRARARLRFARWARSRTCYWFQGLLIINSVEDSLTALAEPPVPVGVSFHLYSDDVTFGGVLHSCGRTSTTQFLSTALGLSAAHCRIRSGPCTDSCAAESQLRALVPISYRVM